VRHVLVNGTPIRVDSESVQNGERPGALLRG
jgi:hypothetical protein